MGSAVFPGQSARGFFKPPLKAAVFCRIMAKYRMGVFMEERNEISEAAYDHHGSFLRGRAFEQASASSRPGKRIRASHHVPLPGVGAHKA